MFTSLRLWHSRNSRESVFALMNHAANILQLRVTCNRFGFDTWSVEDGTEINMSREKSRAIVYSNVDAIILEQMCGVKTLFLKT